MTQKLSLFAVFTLLLLSALTFAQGEAESNETKALTPGSAENVTMVDEQDNFSDEKNQTEEVAAETEVSKEMAEEVPGEVATEEDESTETIEEQVVIYAGMSEEDLRCAAKFECTLSADNKYWYGCYYGEDELCHCFKGLFSECRRELSPLTSEEPAQEEVRDEEEPKAPQNFTAILVGIVSAALVLIIVIISMFSGMPRSSIEKARHYHRLGEQAYERDRIEDADYYYDLARKHRKRAKKG